MKPQRYCHTIRFRGSAYPQGRYQLQISEIQASGQLLYRAQWNFSTLKMLNAFLKSYFPQSQASTPVGYSTLSFENAMSIMDCNELKAA